MFKIRKLSGNFAVLAVLILVLILSDNCAGSIARTPNSKRPAWIDNPNSVFSSDRYLAQVGYGSGRKQAEQNAVANLTAIFGQSVKSESTSFYAYTQALKNGSIEFSEDKSIESEVITSVDMDFLIGSEINEVWYDGSEMYYAIAVMDKQKVIPVYNGLLKANLKLLDDLTNIPSREKNTIYGYSRFLLAASVADVNRVYANVLSVLEDRTNTGNIKNGDEFRLAAIEIAKTIPVAIKINGDTSNKRLENAFAHALNQLGFLSGGLNSRYLLEGDYAISAVITDTQGNVHLRYSLTAGLRDNLENTTIVPFSSIGREGDLNEKAAEDRVIRTLEKSITGEFAQILQELLSASLPN